MSEPVSSSRWRNVLLMCGGSVLFFWQLRHPLIRFAFPPLNMLFGLAWGLFFPWRTAIAIHRLGRWWSRALALAAIPVLLLYSAIFLLFGILPTFAYRDGHDLSFDRLSEIRWKGSDIRLYRTNGGALTDYGVVVRQETALLPGLRLVRQVDMLYPCTSLTAFPTERGIRIYGGGPACEAFQEQRDEYDLKPFLYF